MKIILKKIPPLALLLIGLITIIIILKMFSVAKKPQNQEVVLSENQIPKVKILNLEQKPFQETVRLMGTIKGSKEIEIKFPINGTIEKIYFNQGNPIKKGQIIVNLEQKESKLILKRKKNEFHNN